jgi:hypothetical protein
VNFGEENAKAIIPHLTGRENYVKAQNRQAGAYQGVAALSLVERADEAVHFIQCSDNCFVAISND